MMRMIRVRGRRAWAWVWAWIGMVGCMVATGAFGAEERAAGDAWPTHRGGNARAGMGWTRLSFPLTKAWERQDAAPTPAWGPPARGSYWQRLNALTPRVAEDHVHPVVMDRDAIYQASTTDDLVRCLDASTGAERWTVRVDGPVRYAPVVDGGRVVFGSDDGWIQAVDAKTGASLWRVRPGPRELWIPGNGRLISSWPVRGGLAVADGVVYATAGLYPQQGAWACALDATTGATRWQVPLEDSPEGYLLLTERLVVIPTGRASPVGLDRGTGSLARRFDTGGGTYAVAVDDELFGGPGNVGTLTGVASATGERLIAVPGRHLVAAEGKVYLLENDVLRAVDRARQAVIGRRVKDFERRLREAKGSRSADETKTLQAGLDEARREFAQFETWRVACAANLSLIGAGDALVAGGTNVVIAFDRTSGRMLWRAELDGFVLGLAAAGGRLVAVTEQGRMLAFGPASTTRIDAPMPRSTGLASDATASEAGAWAARADLLATAAGQVREADGEIAGGGGYAVVAGLETGGLAEALLERTHWQVVAVDADPKRAEALRRRAEAKGWYGRRLSVHHWANGELPFVDAFANLVTSERAGPPAATGTPTWTEAALKRLVRPWGGVFAPTRDALPVARGGEEGAGAWTHQYGNPANTANSGDRRVGACLGLQWFGGPGPDVMVDRHLRGPAPLSAGGRLFVPGENRLLAVDAFNGAPLWQRDLPGSQRYTMPYDAGYQGIEGDRLVVTVRDECWVLRTSDGSLTRRIPVPGSGDGTDVHWGWTVLVEGGLYGSAQKPTASRTKPSYELIDADYNHDQPLVTGRAVFRVSPETGATTWRSERGAVLNPTLTWHAGKVLFVEGRRPGLRDEGIGRMPLANVMRGDPWLVALSAETGAVAWERRLEGPLTEARSILFACAAADRVFLVGSGPGPVPARDSRYWVECRRAIDGEVVWTGMHDAGKPGEFTHGEQVHHPVVLGDWLVAEPVAYEVATGRKVAGRGGASDWQLVRPGHSCGTLSGAGDCLFFRAGNPTVLDLRAQLAGNAPPRKLAPSRTGCWINMIPAGGLLLVPEASAGCVCQYSLQTSMAFRPVPCVP